MSPEQAGRALALGRVVAGAAALARPDVALKLFGVDPAENPDAGLVMRFFGSREAFLGASALQSGAVGDGAVRAGVLIDAADAFAAIGALRAGRVAAPAAGALAGAALGAVAIGLLQAAGRR